MVLVPLCSSPARKMFRFKSGDAESPRGGPAPDSPYSLSPVSRDHHIGASLLSPKRAARKIARSPFKVRSMYKCAGHVRVRLCPGTTACEQQL